VTDDLLAAQVAYYRHRAGDYDVSAYGDVAAAGVRIGRLVSAMRPRGHVLEIACGTGMWTEAIAGLAARVTAIDAVPEVVEIARHRVQAANVTFEVAEVFSWSTSVRFDTIFFAAWLSHVPASRYEEFWQLLRGWLDDQGRVLFVDEHVDLRARETYLSGSTEIVERRLRDGSHHRLVKHFLDPDELCDRLRTLGWRSHLHRDGDWVIGGAVPAAG